MEVLGEVFVSSAPAPVYSEYTFGAHTMPIEVLFAASCRMGSNVSAFRLGSACYDPPAKPGASGLGTVQPARLRVLHNGNLAKRVSQDVEKFRILLMHRDDHN